MKNINTLFLYAVSFLVCATVLGGCKNSIFDAAACVDCLQDSINLGKGDPGKVIGSIEGVPVTEVEIVNRLKLLTPTYLGVLSTPERRQEFINRFLQEKVLAHLAKRAGMDHTSEYRLAVKKYQDEWLAQAYREQLIHDMAQSKDELLARAAKSDTLERETQVRLIALKSFKDAQKVQELLRKEPFPIVARKMSINKISANNGGKVARSQIIDPVLMKALQDLKPGQNSGILSTSTGYFILRLEEMGYSKESIQAFYLQQQYIESRADKEKTSLKIDVNNDDFDAILSKNIPLPQNAIMSTTTFQGR